MIVFLRGIGLVIVFMRGLGLVIVFMRGLGLVIFSLSEGVRVSDS